MDKQTFSRYGAIIVVVLILSMMIAFATPFGLFVINSVKDALFGFNSTAIDKLTNPDVDVSIGDGSGNGGSGGSENEPSIAPGLYETGAIALWQAGDRDTASAMLKTSWADLEANGVIAISESEDVELPEINEYGFFFGVPYSLTMEGMTMSFTFNEDGSVIASQTGEIMEIPAGATIYGDHSIDMSATMGVVLEVSSDGTQVGAGGIVLSIGSNLPAIGAVYLPNTTLIEGDLVLPNDGRATSLASSAFYGQTSLTGISIPDSVTSIGGYAFYECSSLTSIVIPDSVISIGEEAFLSCYNLTSATISNSITSIEAYTFAYCSNLTSVTIPDSVTSIGDAAFSGCESLTSVTIPNNVINVGYVAFSNCSSLTSVTIGDSVTRVNNSMFANCSNLTSVTIGDSVTSIGENAFFACSSLTSIAVPNNVTSIDIYAFSSCYNLVSVALQSDTVIAYSINIFTDCRKLETIYVPANLVNSYKAASGWSDFAAKIQAIP